MEKQVTELAIVEIPDLNPRGKQLVEQIERDIKMVPLPVLVTFYSWADAVKKRLDNILKVCKPRLQELRDDPIATKEGDHMQHRRFTFGPASVQIQEKGKQPTINEERACALLKKKRLWKEHCSLTVSVGPPLELYLRKHRLEMEAAGCIFIEHLDYARLDGLIKIKKITPQEAESILDSHEDEKSYSVIPTFSGFEEKMNGTNSVETTGEPGGAAEPRSRKTPRGK